MKTIVVSDDVHRYIKLFCTQHMAKGVAMNNFVDKLCLGEIKQENFREFLEFSKKFDSRTLK